MPTSAIPFDEEFDVVVLGAGAGGMSAAVNASLQGLKVVVLEKEPVFGGTTARSGGWLWIPLSPQAVAAGVADDLASVRTYLRACAGSDYDAAKVEAYLKAGPEMIRSLEAHTDVRFDLGHDFPDYHPQLPGGRDRGRSIVARSIEAKALGDWLPLLAPPLRELSFLGMVIGSGTELKHFFNVTRSARSAVYAARRLLSHGLDLLRHGRGMRLVNGNALAGALGKALKDRNVPLWLGSHVEGLITNDGRVAGVELVHDGRKLRLRARAAVVLATGGFAHDLELRRRLFPHTPTGREHWSLVPAANTGDGIRLGLSKGAAFQELPNAAAWVPVSKVERADGSEGLYPHFVDRGKPGIIAVRADGNRFVNEGDSYHDFVSGLYQSTEEGKAVGAYFICDHPTIRKYGLGVAKPFPVPLGSYLRSGYLTRADTLEGLAQKVGIDSPQLARTVAGFNRHAEQGQDPQFRRGATTYNLFQGDSQRSHPSLAPLLTAPFYAVRILPGSLGTYSGLTTDASARVLDAHGRVIEGLYAVGNDMTSIMGGDYPGGGTMLGPAMTFGYLAALDIARRFLENPPPVPKASPNPEFANH